MSDELIEFFENQIKLENQIVKSVNESLESIDNMAVSTALRGVSLDSSKHAEMYRSAIALLTVSSGPLSEEDVDAQKVVIENHIRMEKVVIKQIEEKLPQISNPKLEVLLKAILADEKRHHGLLLSLHEIIVKGEAVTEGDWWDAIWGDVPGLWA